MSAAPSLALTQRLLDGVVLRRWLHRRVEGVEGVEGVERSHQALAFRRGLCEEEAGCRGGHHAELLACHLTDPTGRGQGRHLCGELVVAQAELGHLALQGARLEGGLSGERVEGDDAEDADRGDQQLSLIHISEPTRRTPISY